MRLSALSFVVLLVTMQAHGGSDKTVSQLGLAWYHDFGSTIGLEATPLVADGVMYTSGVWNILHAMDARTGRPLWSYDPQVPRYWMRFTASKEVITRGAQLYRATCRLCHGLDAVSGGMTPDLRYMSAQTHKDFRDIVLFGKRAKEGMAPFADLYTAADVDAIHAYVIDRAHAARAGAK